MRVFRKRSGLIVLGLGVLIVVAGQALGGAGAASTAGDRASGQADQASAQGEATSVWGHQASAQADRAAARGDQESTRKDQAAGQKGQRAMQVYYLEIVTREVEKVCAAYEAAHGVTFGEPDAGLGQARTAAMPGGGLLGVRAPLNPGERQVVRPYWLVADIEAAVAAVEKAGGQIIHPPLAIPGHGTFAIYYLGDIEHGLWQR